MIPVFDRSAVSPLLNACVLSGLIQLPFPRPLLNPSRGQFPSDDLRSSPNPSMFPERSSTSPTSPNAVRFLPPNQEPVRSSLSSRSLSNPGFRVDNANLRVTMSSICDDSCSSDASRTSTTSSEVEIHISEALQDIEPSYIGEDFVTSSPVPPSWKGEPPSDSPTAWIPRLMTSDVNPALPTTPHLAKVPPRGR
jgi:hypothetical protein